MNSEKYFRDVTNLKTLKTCPLLNLAHHLFFKEAAIKAAAATQFCCANQNRTGAKERTSKKKKKKAREEVLIPTGMDHLFLLHPLFKQPPAQLLQSRSPLRTWTGGVIS